MSVNKTTIENIKEEMQHMHGKDMDDFNSGYYTGLLYVLRWERFNRKEEDRKDLEDFFDKVNYDWRSYDRGDENEQESE